MAVTGFVCVNKPQDITSFVAAAKLRRIFGEKKTGHTGTLDPLATGLLVIALGKATRFIELIPNHDKAYRASFVLGKTTDTLDITGKILSEQKVEVTVEQVKAVLPQFVGEIKQLPPMYSAIRKNGVRLYELARQGIDVEREERDVTVYSLELISSDEEKNEYTVLVSCSAGTYIRSLISDIGDVLGTGAVMTSLCRTRANGMKIENSYSFDELEALKNEGRLSEAVTAVDELLGYEKITVTEAQARRFSNGGELDLNRLRFSPKNGLYCVYSPDGEFLGVGLADIEAGMLRVRKTLSKD